MAAGDRKLSEDRAVHYEVEVSATGEPPWLLYRTALCPAEATRIAQDLLGGLWIWHSRIRRVISARTAQAVEIIGVEGGG